MNCMKCGRETSQDHVFCADCLEEMKKYPVKPGIAIQLPRREHPSALKKAVMRRKTVPTTDDVIKRQKRLIRLMSILILLMALLIGMLALPTIMKLFEDTKPLPGQNYTSLITTEPDDDSVSRETLSDLD